MCYVFTTKPNCHSTRPSQRWDNEHCQEELSYQSNNVRVNWTTGGVMRNAVRVKSTYICTGWKYLLIDIIQQLQQTNRSHTDII